ncbi:hypothetical protein BGZ67_000705 [Mortierella alpina]|nr:hypothetical protein BGZ67_000705 [Mortierella alpina]
MANETPEFMQWRQETDTRISPSSSGSSGCSAASLSPKLPTEFSLSPTSRRFLSLKTYLSKLPEWSNPPRMKSLYSMFTKLKETNKFGYDANVKWWRGVLLGAARNGLLSMCPPNSTLPHYLTSATDEPTETLYEATGSATGILELDLDYVASRFERNRMRPAALPSVMEEMAALGEIVPRSEFLPWAGVSWSGWLIHKTVKVPLLWGLERLGLSNSSPTPRSDSPQLVSTRFGSPGSSGPNGGRGNTSGLLSVDNGIGLGLSSAAPVMSTSPETYVILPFVREAAARIVKLQEEASLHPSDNVMTFQDFRQKFSRTALLPIRGASTSDNSTTKGLQLILTDRDLEILLRYMQYEMNVLMTGKLDINSTSNQVQDYEMIVRFSTKNRLIKEKPRQEITKADRGIIELRQTCKTLEIQVEDVEKRIVEMTEKAQACVKKNQRRQAAYALRTRKHLEDVLQKRLQSLNMLSTILFRIQASETDTQILHSYKLGANTLASIMATKGADGKQVLSLNEVEKTMDQIAETFADQQEVDDAISAGAGTGEISDEELMAELDALVGSSPKSSDRQPFENTPRVEAEATMGSLSNDEAIAALERVLADSPPAPIPGKIPPPPTTTATTLASSCIKSVNSPGTSSTQKPQDDDAEMAELEQMLALAAGSAPMPTPQRREATPPPSLLSSSTESISSLGKRSAQNTQDEDEEMAELEQTFALAAGSASVPIPKRRKATPPPPPPLLSSSAESISSLGKRSADTEDEEETAVKQPRVKNSSVKRAMALA